MQNNNVPFKPIMQSQWNFVSIELIQIAGSEGQWLLDSTPVSNPASNSQHIGKLAISENNRLTIREQKNAIELFYHLLLTLSLTSLVHLHVTWWRERKREESSCAICTTWGILFCSIPQSQTHLWP